MKTLFFFRSGGAPGLLREYPGLLRSETSMNKRKNYDEKMHLKGDKNPILRRSKLPCLKPRKPMPDPKNEKIEKIKKSKNQGKPRKTMENLLKPMENLWKTYGEPMGTHGNLWVLKVG